MSDVERRLRQFPAEFPRPREEVTRRVADRLKQLPPAPRPRRRWSSAALVAATVAGGALVGMASIAVAGDAGWSAAGDPTIFARVYKDGPSTYVALSGRIPSNNGGEPVELLERVCGLKEFRIARGTNTVPGGFWELEPLFFFDSVTYVARWNGRLSDEVMLRGPLHALALPRGPRRWRIQVGTRQQNMSGRIIVLQRKTSDGRWVRVRQARMKRLEFYGVYGAVFTVRQRGLTLRGFVPQQSARPCHDAEATATFRS